MSLTSYRAAPPRVRGLKAVGSRFGGLLPIADCLLRRTDGCEEEANVLGRPGDDLLSRVLRQSTIGAEAFDGRVRDGIGSDRLAESHQAGKGRSEAKGEWRVASSEWGEGRTFFSIRYSLFAIRPTGLGPPATSLATRVGK